MWVFFAVCAWEIHTDGPFIFSFLHSEALFLGFRGSVFILSCFMIKYRTEKSSKFSHRTNWSDRVCHFCLKNDSKQGCGDQGPVKCSHSRLPCPAFPHHFQHFTVTDFGFALLFRPQRIYTLIKMSPWLSRCMWSCTVENGMENGWRGRRALEIPCRSTTRSESTTPWANSRSRGP